MDRKNSNGGFVKMSKNPNIKSPKEKFQEKLNSIRGENKFIVLGEYVKNSIKTLVKCGECDYEWNVLPMQLTRSNKPTGCPSCSNNVKKTTESFKREVYDLVGDEYTVLGEYVRNSEPIKMRHNICNEPYSVRPNDFQQGYRCPNCAHGHKLKTQEEFEKDVYDAVGDEYKVMSEYKGTGKHVVMQHNTKECGYEYKVYPRNFLSNKNRCPLCNTAITNESKGSIKIKEFLEFNNIEYELEKAFDDCKDVRLLKFDFYIPSINLLLEFDGNQHFNETKFLKGEDFINSRKRDDIKNQWCLEHNANLLRLDEKSIRQLENIWKYLFNDKRSTTIKKRDFYYIENGELIFDNNRYTIHAE